MSVKMEAGTAGYNIFWQKIQWVRLKKIAAETRSAKNTGYRVSF